MKHIRLFAIPFILAALHSCQSTPTNEDRLRAEALKADSLLAAMQLPPEDNPALDGLEQAVDTIMVPCGKVRLTDIDDEAHRQIKDKMFHSIGTNGMERWEGYFTQKNQKELLVSLPGSSTGSSGNAQNLAMLLSCSDPTHALWAEQVGDLQVIDLNGDGLMEVVNSVNTTWMGECADFYDIYTFRNGKEENIFSRESHSVVGCGGEWITSNYHKGDTLTNQSLCSLTYAPTGKWQVKVVRDISIHNGGKTEEEIVAKLRHISDTTYVTLK